MTPPHHFNKSNNCSITIRTNTTTTTTTTTRVLCQLLYVWILTGASFVWTSVAAGRQPYDLMLEPTDTFIHYNDGYIRAPGYIDISPLTFTAISESYGTDDAFENDDYYLDPKDNNNNNNDDDPNIDNNDDPIRRQSEEINNTSGNNTYIDIAIFSLPQKCVHSKAGCDWAKLGVGKRSSDNRLHFCCSKEARELDLCDDTTFGRFLIDETKYSGYRRFVVVPDQGPMTYQIRYGKIEETTSATYVVVYTNCNSRGRIVQVQGETVWKSEHGYLPGELYGFMIFYTVITLAYFAVLGWYGVSMYINQASRIDIEKWIFAAICLGMVEMIFRTSDYYIWNADGYRSVFVYWVGVTVGIVKQSMSRCLIVMVSLGWGVVRDTLGYNNMRAIIILGAVYVGLSLAGDLIVLVAFSTVNTLSVNDEETIFDFVRILALVQSAVDVIFIVWILDALGNTMLYLENMNQTRKLKRYLQLRCIFLISILFATVWTVFALVNTVDEEGIVQEEHVWALEAAPEANYLFVLIGVAFLWRPSPTAREYAYVMELPLMDSGEGGNELELTGDIPSAMDSDDDMDGLPSDSGNGFHDDSDKDGVDNRFEIS